MISSTSIAIKAHILTLDLDLEIEVKAENGVCRLLIIRSKSGVSGDKGQVWHGVVQSEAPVLELADLIVKCYENPSIPHSITIADGMHVSLKAMIHGESIDFTIKEFEEKTPERILTVKLLELCRQFAEDFSVWL